MTRGFGIFLRDNLEAFAVAIAMALVIRHYCIEAFRIPTGSMQPTLYGDEPGRRQGDRILVDKLVWLRRDPHRYEVAVFQFPLNRNRNYIKRIVGLPGEWLRVADGDVWVSVDEGVTWELTRKSAGAREQLLFPYYPNPPDYEKGFGRRACWRGDPGWEPDEPSGRFAVDAQDEERTLTFDRKVLPYKEVDAHGSPAKPHVGDVRVSFTANVERAGSLVVNIAEHGRIHRLHVGASESFVEIGGGRRIPLEGRLREGETEISLANVDDTLVVVLDGEAREFLFPDTPSQPPPPPSGPEDGIYASGREHSISISATNTKALLTELRIDRDIYYFEHTGLGRSGWSGTWEIPEDCYLMFGDNTMSSSDSREWLVTKVRLRDGTVLEWVPGSQDDIVNPYANDDRDGLVTIPADVDGLVRRYRVDEVLGEPEEGVARPYVTRDHLIGRAFAVFWPIYVPPLYKGGTRVKIIR